MALRSEQASQKTGTNSGWQQTVRDRANSAGRAAGVVARDAADNPFIGFIAWLLAIGLAVALVRVAMVNIQPYFALFKAGGDEAPWIANLPVLGGMIKAFNSTISAVGGILVWAVVQIFQVLWIVIWLDRQAKRGALRQAQKGGINAEGFRDARARRIAKSHNSIPFFFLRWSGLLALAAYAFDFAIGITQYPPAKNLQVFFFALASGITSQINGANVLKLLIMMFSFEALLLPFVIVVFWIRARQDGADAQ